MRRFLTVLLALCLLAGCGPQLDRFPRVETTAPTYPAQTLTIDIPLGADQFTQDGVAQLAAAVLELSGGAVTLGLTAQCTGAGTAIARLGGTVAILGL